MSSSNRIGASNNREQELPSHNWAEPYPIYLDDYFDEVGICSHLPKTIGDASFWGKNSAP